MTRGRSQGVRNAFRNALDDPGLGMVGLPDPPACVSCGVPWVPWSRAHHRYWLAVPGHAGGAGPSGHLTACSLLILAACQHRPEAALATRACGLALGNSEHAWVGLGAFGCAWGAAWVD